MTTITAKDLRDNLGDITKRVAAGEHVYVTYRNKLAIRLEPALPEEDIERKPNQGLDAFLATDTFSKDTDPKKGTKELYHKALDSKYDQ